MENWQDAHESFPQGDDFAQLQYFARIIKGQPSLGLSIGSSLSIKAGYRTIFGTEEPGLAFLEVTLPGSTVFEEMTWLKLSTLIAITKLEELSSSQFQDAIQLSQLQNTQREISKEAVLHAVIPAKAVAILHPAPLLSILHTLNYQERVTEIYGKSLLTLQKNGSILNLAREIAKESCFTAGCLGIAIPGYGLIVHGDTPQDAYKALAEIVNSAEQYLKEQKVYKPVLENLVKPDTAQVKEIPILRQAISSEAGFPVVIALDQSDLALNFARMEATRPDRSGPVLVQHAAYLHAFPLKGRDIKAYKEDYAKEMQMHAPNLPMPLDVTPRVILDPQLGILYLGRTAQEAAQGKSMYRTNIEMILQSTALGDCSPIPMRDLLEFEAAEQKDVTKAQIGNKYLTGEVALVTGAASGIGKACVVSFLDRGASVVGLDINPSIEGLFSQPNYLGIRCDITDEEAIRSVLLETICHFGGLDMLVLNAGIFPASCRIDALPLTLWDQVRRVNLDANLVLMRESFPLLKVAPHCGRVVIIGSRNQRAPGPGAVAYSLSKAAVTQLARVAALEWGSDQIRVNVIHPDSVFDTALYNEEILQIRSATYGMTVEQYKKRNVLKVEITSRDVGELTAEMCGPLFAKITGAQIPLDGGNERVI